MADSTEKPADDPKKVAILEASPLYNSGMTGVVMDKVNVYQKGNLLMTTQAEFLELLKKDFKVRDDDVWVITYPKTGTTWMTEMAGLLMNGGDREKLLEQKNHYAQNFCMRFDLFLDQTLDAQTAAQTRVSQLNGLKGQRMIVTHLPEAYVPPQVYQKKSKMIVTIRNPKDTAVSYYHFHRMNNQCGRFKGTFSEYLKGYADGKAVYGDFFEWNLDFWRKYKNEPHFFFVMFEEMKKNPAAVVKRVAKFLDVPLPQELLESVVSDTDFVEMKDKVQKWMQDSFPILDNSISPFFRKGSVGDWKNHFTVAESEAFDRLTEQRMKGITDLKFIYE